MKVNDLKQKEFVSDYTEKVASSINLWSKECVILDNLECSKVVPLSKEDS